MSNFRKGDLVSVVGVVEFDEHPGERVLIKFEDGYGGMTSFPAAALNIRRQKIIPGENIKYEGEWMTAIAADGSDLWVRKTTGETMVLGVNDVERAPLAVAVPDVPYVPDVIDISEAAE